MSDEPRLQIEIRRLFRSRMLANEAPESVLPHGANRRGEIQWRRAFRVRRGLAPCPRRRSREDREVPAHFNPACFRILFYVPFPFVKQVIHDDLRDLWKKLFGEVWQLSPTGQRPVLPGRTQIDL